MKKLEVRIDRLVSNKHKFREEDVTKDAVNRFNMTKALTEIAELEKELTSDAPSRLIQDLNSKYQQVHV